MFRYEKIVVPLDGSELAEQALPPALAIAKAMDAKLILLRVIPSLLLTVDPQVYEQMYQWQEDEAATYLHQMQAKLDKANEAKATAETTTGPTGEAIIDYAQQNGADLIVMSSHGRSGISRWVYGSVAEKVLRGATCATLVVRGQEVE